MPTNENIHKQWDFLNRKRSTKDINSTQGNLSKFSRYHFKFSGFSNTAEEMDMAESQLMKRVIEPKQRYILDALEEILVAYDINLDLYFKPLTEPVRSTNAIK